MERKEQELYCAFYQIAKASLDQEAFNAVRSAAKLYAKYGEKQHFEIISSYIHEPIGCTSGRLGIGDVLREEPTAELNPVKFKECRSCKGGTR